MSTPLDTSDAATAPELEIVLTPLKPALVDDRRQTLDVLLRLVARRVAPLQRTPLSLSLAIDRSGSMRGHKLQAAKAAQWGLIWECHPDDQLGSAVDALCAQLAQLPTHAMVRTRQAMLAAQAHTLTEHLAYEAMLMHELGRSADYVEGVTAFLQKRPARFGKA